jgi:hypothetical protein
MVTADKPAPGQALSSAGPDELMQGKQEGGDQGRTRIAMPAQKLWGDRALLPGQVGDPKRPC